MINRVSNVDHTHSSQEACETMRSRLSEYATLAALGERPEATFPEVAAHLETCSVCREQMAELQALMEATFADTIETAPAYPRPDLSFLRSATKAQDTEIQPWRVDRLGQIVFSFSQTLLDTLQPPALLGLTRGKLLCRYVTPPGALHDLNITIEVAMEDRARDKARVRVGVEMLAADAFDQSGASVSLYFDGTSLTGETDETGFVDFTPVPAESLTRLRIMLRPRSWTP